MRLFLDLLALVRALSADRARLALENVVLCQQLNVLRESGKARPRAKQLAAWGAVRRTRKREALRRLELLG